MNRPSFTRIHYVLRNTSHLPWADSYNLVDFTHNGNWRDEGLQKKFQWSISLKTWIRYGDPGRFWECKHMLSHNKWKISL